jgi:hypothetical protein
MNIDPVLAGPTFAERLYPAVPSAVPALEVEIQEGLSLAAFQAQELSDALTAKP